MNSIANTNIHKYPHLVNNQEKNSYPKIIHSCNKNFYSSKKSFQLTKWGLGYLKSAPHFEDLTELEVALVGLFWNEKRFFKGSYREAAAVIGFDNRRTAQHLLNELEQADIIKVKTTFYKNTKIRGRNIYTLKKKGKNLLQAIVNKAFTGKAISAEVHPLITIEKGKVRRLLKKEKLELQSAKENPVHKDILNKLSTNKRRENLSLRSGFFRISCEEDKVIQKEFSKRGLLRCLEQANTINLTFLRNLPLKLLKQILRKIEKRLKGIRHFWKYFTAIANDALQDALAWPKKRSKDIRDAVDGINSKGAHKTNQGIDTQAVRDCIREIEKQQKQKFSREDLEILMNDAKCSISKLRIALERTAGFSPQETSKHDVKLPYQKGTIPGVKQASGSYYFKRFNTYSHEKNLTVYAIPSRKKLFRSKEDAIEYCKKHGLLMSNIPPKTSKNLKKQKTPKVNNYMGLLRWLLKKEFTNKSELYRRAQ